MVSAAKRRPPERLSASYFSTRMMRMAAFVGYSAADGEVIAATRGLIAPRAAAIADGVHGALAAEPETSFYLADNEPTCFDDGHAHFRTWLATALGAALDDALAEYLTAAGRAHTKRGGRTAGRISARYLVAAMSLVQAAVTAELARGLRRKRDLGRAVSAWHKLLTIHLDLMLAVYGRAEGNAHWY